MSALTFPLGTALRWPSQAAEGAPRDPYAGVRERWRTARRRLGEIVVNLAEDPHARMATWKLPASGSAAATARHLTRARLDDWGLAEQADVAELLVSELVTNSLQHGKGPVQLTLSVTEDVLRVEVADGAAGMPRLREAREDEEGGRGLWLLDQLARCWGGTRTSEGKVVWFELPGRQVHAA
ncbi:ATP-binding protein [Microbispora sp. ATCC PTA-5024]|uniref:ATP-binding protein n=1 Tax=Microbispora sp. ATCC PTA-5024 TaxID=316330 RepID=UPI0003DD005D|nr:ATP-binding protein [Microbispora sp. ATCC PTA-5024]ETK34718.1 hypothetical protein MPTA5024_18285 [Microbispora sp. ATCC PTA-5024]